MMADLSVSKVLLVSLCSKTQGDQISERRSVLEPPVEVSGHVTSRYVTSLHVTFQASVFLPRRLQGFFRGNPAVSPSGSETN